MQNRDDICSNIYIGPFWLDEAIIIAEKEPLYRGSGFHFDDAFYFGFKASGTNTDLVAHTFPTDGNEFFKDSAYISTSLSRENAKKFPYNLFPGKNRSYVYEIYSTKSTIDVMSEISHEVSNGRINAQDFNNNLQFQERAFISRISPYEIKGGWEVMHRKVKIQNPSELPFSKQQLNLMSDEALEFFCYEKERHIIGSFVPNPNYRWPEKILIKTLKTTAGVGVAFGIAVDGLSLRREYIISKLQNDYTNTYREIARISGGWTGALILGSQSAKAGALVCSPIAPPFGAIGCSFAGGLVGSGIGYFAGSKSATKIFDINWSKVYQNFNESHSKNYEAAYKIKKFKRKMNVLPNLFKSTVNFHKTNSHLNHKGVKSMLNRTEQPIQNNGYIFGQLKPIFMAEERERQHKELRQGEKQFNHMLQAMEKDPVGTANLLATSGVKLEIEMVKNRLDTIIDVSFEHLDRSGRQLDELLENNQKLDRKLDQKLKTLIENNKEVRQQLLIVTDNIKSQAEQKRIQENKQGLLDAAGFVGALGQHVGNQDLCRMATLAHAGFTIANSLAALQGPMALASLSPVSAIGIAALSVISAFANKGPNINQIMLDAIQSLAKQVNELRKEMHDRFDKIDNHLAKIYLRIIDGFCDILNQNKNMMEILIDIRNFLRDFKIDVKDYFSTVNETLRGIQDHAHVVGRQNKLEKLYKNIAKADMPQTLDASEFKNLYNEFYSEICGLHQNNKLLVGGYTELHPVTSFELDKRNSFAADFNINALYDYLTMNKQENRTFLVNPTIWSWQLMGFMELLKRFYQKDEKATKITKAELKHLEGVATIGNQTLDFLHSIRNQELMRKLLHEHIQAGHLLEQELSLYVDKDEKAKTKELNQQLKKTFEYCAGPDAGSTFEEFKEEKITFDTQAHDSWFTAESYNSHTVFGKDHSHHYRYRTATNIDKKIKDYIEARQLSVDQKKSDIKKEAQTKLGKIENNFYYFSPSNLGNNYCYSFMLPQNKIHPILPLPKNIFFPIPQALQLAQWLGLGYVQFQYQVQEVEAKHAIADAKEGIKKQNLVIEAVWNSEKERNILFTFSTAYHPGIYGYKRVILFAPLNKSAINMDPKTILMHHTGGNLTAHWKVNNLTYSKSLLESDAKDILSVLPEPGHESNDATLIRAIITKFRCEPKENEALWWWWVGGNCSLAGATYVSTVYSNTTPQQNTWTHEANLPVCSEMLGKIDTLKLNINNDNKAEFKVHVTEDSLLIRQVHQQITTKKMTMLESFYQDLNKEIGNNTASKLGKAFITYSHTFYMLKSALALAFGENVLKSYPEFRYFYDETVLNNRLRFLSQLGSLGKENISLLEKLKNNLQVCEAQIVPGLVKLFSDSHPDSILALALKEWNVLMEWYKKHSVDENPICSSMSVEAKLKEQVNMYGIAFSVISSGIASLSPEIQLAVLNSIQEQMKKNDIVLTGNAKGLLTFDKSNSSTESKRSPHSLFPLKPIPTTLATDQGIFAALQKKLGNTVHIINPALSSRSNLFSGEMVAAMEYAKEINGYIPIENTKEDKHSRTGFIYEDGGELKKPIVAILNTASVRAAHSADTQATGGSHWVAMVVLPKNYKDLKNKNEKIFLLDSLYPERRFPPEFKTILTQGGIHNFSAPASEHANAPQLERQHKILPMFPDAEFVHLDEFKKQQEGYTDCGWWALDNALKLIESGTLTEIMKNYNGSRRADHLRNEYPDLDKEHLQLVNREVLKC